MDDPATGNAGKINWNENGDFFRFTRGRFVVDEARQMALRTVKFDLNRLAQVAADSVGAEHCIHVDKFPDGMYNKAYLFRMSDGQEVVGRVPNPVAGLPHLTTASEVATMHFVRIYLAPSCPLFRPPPCNRLLSHLTVKPRI